jgi:hypothetical protein
VAQTCKGRALSNPPLKLTNASLPPVGRLFTALTARSLASRVGRIRTSAAELPRAPSAACRPARVRYLERDRAVQLSTLWSSTPRRDA